MGFAATRGARLVAVAVATALIATACTANGDDALEPPPPGGETADGVLTLGSLLPQTGELADFGPSMRAGVDLALADLEAAAHLMPMAVVSLARDSGSSADVAATATTRLLSEAVDAIIGPAGSSVALLGVIDPAVAAGRIVCSPSNVSPVFSTYQDRGLYFRLAPSDRFQARLLVELAVEDGAEHIAVLHRTDAYGQAYADAITDALVEVDREPEATIAIDPEAVDAPAAVAELAGAGADAVILVALAGEGGPVLAEMLAQGLGPESVPVYVSDGLATDTIAQEVSPEDVAALNGVKGTRAGPGPDSGDFDARLRDESGVDATDFGAEAYDCVTLIALAAVAAGSDDPALIAARIVDVSRDGVSCSGFAECAELLAAGDDIDYDGATGVDLDDRGEPVTGAYDVIELVDGAVTVLETRTMTSPPEVIPR